MIRAFKFESDGRTYCCAAEKLSRTNGQAWWWFQVSGDGHRYAPFQAAAGDTPESVGSRIVEYYNNRLARRAAPPAPPAKWGRPQQSNGSSEK